eukprot:710848-Hanusia_phi.AAC.1
MRLAPLLLLLLLLLLLYPHDGGSCELSGRRVGRDQLVLQSQRSGRRRLLELEASHGGSFWSNNSLFPVISFIILVGGGRAGRKATEQLVACWVTGGDLFSADNKTVCLLMMGAALQIMSLLLISPLAAFVLTAM